MKHRTLDRAIRVTCEALELRCLLNAPGANYTLAFDDEFSGTSLNTSKWSLYLPWTNTTTNDNRYEQGNYLGYMESSDLTESGGQLHLNTTKANNTVNGHTFNYTSVSITTNATFWTTYGYAEVRAELPTGPGNWPAFWSLGNGWPPENDIMEDWPATSTNHQGLAEGTNNNATWFNTYPAYFANNTYHTYAMKWGPGFEDFYEDGTQTLSITNSGVPAVSMYFLLNSGVASGQVNSYSNSNDNELNVDYVRIYSYTPGGAAIANASFDVSNGAAGGNPYTLSGSAAIVNGSTIGLTGTGDLHIYGSPGEADQLISGLTPNTTYTFTGWAEIGSGTTAGIIGVKSFDSNGTVVTSPIGDTGQTSPSWVQGSVEFTTGPSNTSATIYVSNPNSNNLNFDDLALVRATTLANISGFAGQPGAVTNVPLNVTQGAAGGFYSLSATSSNTALVANSGLSISGGVLKVTPIGTQEGTTTITVTGTDTFDTPISESFPVTISDGITFSGDAGGVSTADTFRLVRDGANVDVYINNTTTTPTTQFPYSAFSATNISGLTGNNSLIIDYSGGDPITSGGINWTAGTAATNNLSVVNLSGNNTIIATHGTTLQINSDVINYTFVATMNLDLGSGTNTFNSVQPTTAPTITLNEDAGGTTTMATGSGVIPTHSILNIASGGTFSFNNQSQSIDQLSGAGTLSLGSSTLTIGAQNGTSTFSGSLTGTGGLTKIGMGTFVLSGNNTFTGAANIGTGSNPAGDGNGILRITSSGALADISRLTLTDNSGSYDLFQIDGSAGPVTLSAPITLNANSFSGPNGVPATIFENVAGNNTVSGPITFTTGGAGYGIQSDVGSSIAFTDPYTLTHIIFLRGAGNGSFTNVLSGAGSVTLQSSGNWTFSGANTYTGTTIISTGQLTLANNSALPAASALTLTTGATLGLQGGITVGRALTFTGSGAGGVGSLVNVSGNNTWSSPLTLAATGATIGSTAGTLTLAAISGGPLTTVGGGAIQLAATNTYTGGTSINGATVNFASLASLGSGSVNFGGGTLQYAAGNTVDISTRAVTLGTGGGTIDTNGNNVSFANAIGNGGTGGLTKAGAGTLVLNGIGYSGNTAVTGGTLEVASGNLASANISTSVGAILNLDPGVSIAAAPSIVDQGTISLTPSGSSQTLTSLSGSGILNFNIPVVLTITNGGNFSGTILPSGTTLTLTGGTLTFSAIGNLGSGPITLSGGTLQFAPGNSSDISSLGITIGPGGGTIDTNGNNITFASSIGNGGTGGLTKIGAGTLTLSAANTFGGGTNINSGVLNFSSLANFGSGANLNISGGTLQYATGNTVDISTLTVTLGASGGTIDTNGNNVNFAASIGNSGAGGLTKAGLGTLVLNGTSYGGNASVTGGTLELASGSLGSANVGTSAGATLTIDSGAAILPLTNLTDNGTTNFNNASQAIATLSGSGTLNLGSGIAFDVSGGGNFAGVITDPGATLSVSGGALVLSGVNTYTGDTDITGGSLEIASPGSLAGNNINISAGGTLTVDAGAAISSGTNLDDAGTANFNNDTPTIATLSGSGVLNFNGTSLTVTGGGTYGGSIAGNSLIIAGGQLTFTSTAAIAVSAITVNASATADISATVIGVPTVIVNGNLNFGSADSSNDPLSGILAYNLGALTLGASGDLVVAPAATSATRAVVSTTTLSNFAGGTIDLNNNDMIVFGNDPMGVPGQPDVSSADPTVIAKEIISSSVVGDPTILTLAVYEEDGSFGTFDGQSINAGDVVVKYTYYGDADLSGGVDAGDYALIDNGFNSQSGADPLTGWFNGDFNGDGKINGDDYTLIDNAFNEQAVADLPQISASNASQIAAPVNVKADTFSVGPAVAVASDPFADLKKHGRKMVSQSNVSVIT